MTTLSRPKSALARPELWLALALLLANLFQWGRLLSNLPAAYTVEPVQDEEIVALLDTIRSGQHAGETWQVTLTEQEAEQTIAWYLERYPQIPFANPRVRITPQAVSGEGDVTLGGLRVHVSGKASIRLRDGLPQVTILELSLPLPDSMRRAIEFEIQRQLRRANRLPVRFTAAEWQDGQVIVQGVIR